MYMLYTCVHTSCAYIEIYCKHPHHLQDRITGLTVSSLCQVIRPLSPLGSLSQEFAVAFSFFLDGKSSTMMAIAIFPDKSTPACKHPREDGLPIFFQSCLNMFEITLVCHAYIVLQFLSQWSKSLYHSSQLQESQ